MSIAIGHPRHASGATSQDNLQQRPAGGAGAVLPEDPVPRRLYQRRAGSKVSAQHTVPLTQKNYAKQAKSLRVKTVINFVC
jgi:hypothetical protein